MFTYVSLLIQFQSALTLSNEIPASTWSVWRPTSRLSIVLASRGSHRSTSSSNATCRSLNAPTMIVTSSATAGGGRLLARWHASSSVVGISTSVLPASGCANKPSILTLGAPRKQCEVLRNLSWTATIDFVGRPGIAVLHTTNICDLSCGRFTRRRSPRPMVRVAARRYLQVYLFSSNGVSQ